VILHPIANPQRPCSRIMVFASLKDRENPERRIRMCVVGTEICDEKLRAKSKRLVLVERPDALFVLVLIGQHMEMLDLFCFSIPLVIAFSKPHHTAEGHVPAIDTSRMISF